VRYSETKATTIAVLATIVLLLSGGEGYPIGMSAEPGGLVIQHIKPGEPYDIEAKTGLHLKILNQSSEQRSYRVSVASPEQLGITRWTEGYSPIPDPRWFYLEPTEIEIAPQSSGYARMFIKIPDKREYFNQHWVVALAIESIPKRGEILSLALKPVYYLETESREDIAARTNEPLGLAPTVLECPVTAPGQDQSRILCGEMKIYNGDSRAHTYTINSEVPSLMASKQKVSPSPGFTWLEHPDTVMVTEEHPTVKPGKTGTVGVLLVTTPGKTSQHSNRESLLWVSPDGGMARFIRIQCK